MPALPIRLDPSVHLRDGFDAIRDELDLPRDFPSDVLAEADAAARRGPAIPADVDLRDVPFFTVDPPGSADLDQAVALERQGSGYLVRYAIADVAAFVAPGGPIDDEARRRGVTVYLPDRNIPLHPIVLSEGAASLLPDVDRQALVWEITLDADGEAVGVVVRRATVRSRARHSYAEVQRAIDDGTAEEPLQLLRAIGQRREEAEAARGGVSLPIPEQEVTTEGDRYRIGFRSSLPAEGWNAQLSLLTGIAAAAFMLDAGVGVLRTLPPAPDEALAELRRHALALDVAWPSGTPYAEVLRALDPGLAAHAAFLAQAVRLFRGAGYLAFDGTRPVGDVAVHAAVAAPYAHVTAPLRRLVDRFGAEVALATSTGAAVPAWASEALPALPELLATSTRRASAADAMARDLVEAATLAGCVGTVVEGVVVAVRDGGVRVQVRDPAVIADVEGVEGPGPALGDVVRLRVEGADVGERTVRFELAPA